jgi:hypothetical protein
MNTVIYFGLIAIVAGVILLVAVGGILGYLLYKANAEIGISTGPEASNDPKADHLPTS